ncbi:MAG: flap endonuclease-1 [Methanobacteriota archaeon]|nr:MAG: flap endonuclease-1 [Euryarchaeota archaeon]
MGVNLSPLLEGLKNEKEIGYFARKTIAFDAYNTLYQFLASIRQPDGTPLKDFDGNITSHLSGLFYRSIKMMSKGIKLVFVFDGKPPKFKYETIEERKKKKEEAEALLQKAKDMEEVSYMEMYAKQTIRLTKDMVKESKELLSAMGIAYVQAPSEGEAEAAHLAANGSVDASASQDYDSLLFGSPKLVRNLSVSERRKLPRRNEYITVKPEEIILTDVLKSLSISKEQLVMIGLLIGNDFNKGVKGVGPKTALKIVKEYKELEEMLTFTSNKYDHEFEPYIRDVYEFFLNPPVVDANVEEGEMDEEKVLELLVEKHDFSRERIEHGIENIKKIKEEERQHSIKEWF